MKRHFILLVIGAMAATFAHADNLVSVGGPITEVVYALGAQDRLVAVDTSSVYPEEAKKLPQVGYQRNIAAEGVLSLKPDLVILSETAGPPTAIEQIRNTGVRVEIISESHTLAGAIEKVQRVGEILGRKAEADAIVAKMKAQLAESKQPSGAQKPKVVFLMSRGQGPPVIAGSKTAASAMIGLAGGQNVGDSFEGYKTLSPEALVEMAPDIILTTTRTRDMVGADNLIKSTPGLDLTPAGKNARIICIEDLLLLGFGPRVGEALHSLREGFAAPSANLSAR